MLFKQSLKHPDIFNLISGKVDFDKDFTSINRCIGLILTTGKGELLGDPELVCRLYELLFNQYNAFGNKEDQLEFSVSENLDKSRVYTRQ